MLEIAYWKPIEVVIGMADPQSATFGELAGVRDMLFKEQRFQDHIKANVSERYANAVQACLRGREAFGIAVDANELDLSTGVLLRVRMKSTHHALSL